MRTQEEERMLKYFLNYTYGIRDKKLIKNLHYLFDTDWLMQKAI